MGFQPGPCWVTSLLLWPDQHRFHQTNCRSAAHGDALSGGLLAERYRGAQLSHKDTFYSSLICHVRPGCRLLHCFDDAEGAAFSWTGWVTPPRLPGVSPRSGKRLPMHTALHDSAEACLALLAGHCSL